MIPANKFRMEVLMLTEIQLALRPSAATLHSKTFCGKAISPQEMSFVIHGNFVPVGKWSLS
jgi:hypothetical protein